MIINNFFVSILYQRFRARITSLIWKKKLVQKQSQFSRYFFNLDIFVLQRYLFYLAKYLVVHTTKRKDWITRTNLLSNCNKNWCVISYWVLAFFRCSAMHATLYVFSNGVYILPAKQQGMLPPRLNMRRKIYFIALPPFKNVLPFLS